jgi:hypothetical protein
MADEKEPFLARWSRLKRENPAEPARERPEEERQPEKPVPPLESLTPESDFSAFMQPKVKEELRRLALKKLFRDPHFNIPDPFEPFSGDWTTGAPIAPDMLAKLTQTRTLLMTHEERKALEEKEQLEEPPIKEAKQDEPGRQDT